MVANPLPDQDRLNALFHYDGLTGQLTRKISTSPKAQKGMVVGSKLKSGHLQVNIDHQKFLVHRIIWKMRFGSEPEVIDHIDGDPANNKLINLRNGTQLDNTRNQKRHRDGVAGVSWFERDKCYRARIYVNGYAVHLGLGDYDHCVALRKAAEQKYWNDGQAAN